jgi:IMP cyclohydrolase (EC 3.5.4.10)/phosphoribosylaminoimidazolecarboxamide formyltransferase (EC 2.1.2.3)
MAAFYADAEARAGLAEAKQLHGKELSFNNIMDLNAAVEIVKEFDNPAVVFIKHNNPCGAAEDKDIIKAYKNAWECDKLSAFGGIVGINRAVDKKLAEVISKSGFLECVIAPSFKEDALAILKEKKNVRLMEMPFEKLEKREFDLKKVSGGLLLQDKDAKMVSASDLKTVTNKKPTKNQLDSLLFAWKICKHTKSNAIVLAKGTKTSWHRARTDQPR